jgi:hypothetical protein
MKEYIDKIRRDTFHSLNNLSPQVESIIEMVSNQLGAKLDGRKFVSRRVKIARLWDALERSRRRHKSSGKPLMDWLKANAKVRSMLEPAILWAVMHDANLCTQSDKWVEFRLKQLASFK